MLNKNGKLMTRIYSNDLSTMSSVTIRDTTNAVASVGSGYTEFLRVAVGSNDTDVSTDDYKVTDANNDNLGLTLLSSNASYNHTYADDYVATFTSVYKNNTANDITIKEVGVYMHHTSSPQVDVMISRDAGASVRRVVTPGETATVSVTIGE